MGKWKNTHDPSFQNQAGSLIKLNSKDHPMAVELDTEDLLPLLYPGEVLRQEFRVPRRNPHCERRPNEIA